MRDWNQTASAFDRTAKMDPFHRTRIHWSGLPSLSSPGTVGCDDHLPAVVGVGVVYVKLQALPLVALDQGEQVLGLQRGGGKKDAVVTTGGPQSRHSMRERRVRTSRRESPTSFMTVSAPMM